MELVGELHQGELGEPHRAGGWAKAPGPWGSSHKLPLGRGGRGGGCTLSFPPLRAHLGAGTLELAHHSLHEVQHFGKIGGGDAA